MGKFSTFSALSFYALRPASDENIHRMPLQRISKSWYKFSQIHFTFYPQHGKFSFHSVGHFGDVIDQCRRKDTANDTVVPKDVNPLLDLQYPESFIHGKVLDDVRKDIYCFVFILLPCHFPP